LIDKLQETGRNMKYRKRLNAVLLSVAIAFVGLAGCGGGGGGSGDGSNAGSAASSATSTVPASLDGVDTNDRATVLDLYRNVLLPARATSSSWTGSTAQCVAGDTSADFKASVVRTVNYFRVMAGLPGNVTLNLEKSAKAQQAALMMRANHQLDHAPPPSWLCYSAEGAEAAGNSNLALGNFGARSVSGYVGDAGVASLGHRRWILYSALSEVGTGDTDGSNALWVFGPRAPIPASVFSSGIAWPPRGYVPRLARVSDPTMVWSLSLPAADFSNATITMTNDAGANIAVQSLGQLDPGYGDNTFAWQIQAAASEWERSPADTKLTVTVSNIRVGGNVQTIQYDVIFITP
jgi:uncharacterized protein YkwD